MHDSHQKAAEYHSLAAHAHRTAAEHHGQEDHLTGHEHSRQALEHSNKAYRHSLQVHQKARTEHGAIVLVRKSERRTSRPSLINSGKLDAVQRDHRKKIGSVRSKNCDLAISRDGSHKRASRGSLQPAGPCPHLRSLTPYAGSSPHAVPVLLPDGRPFLY